MKTTNIEGHICPKHMVEKTQPLLEMFLEKLYIHRQKTETKSMSFTQYKYQLKMD
jgi:hypothetical protein